MHRFRVHRRGRPPHPDVLTPAEWRVLEHLREGASNAEIASRLGVSINTVRTHVASMLQKLDFRSRRELAQWQGRPTRPRPGLAMVALGAVVAGSAAATVAVAVVVVVVIGSTSASDAPTEALSSTVVAAVPAMPVSEDSGWATCVPSAGIVVEYPPHWGPDPERRTGLGDCAFEGDDGFLLVSAFNPRGGRIWSLDEGAELHAGHHLEPLGATPRIERLAVDGHDARLILPSEDQDPGNRRMAELLVALPDDIGGEAASWHHLLIYADADHIEEIAARLRFDDGATGPEVSPPPPALAATPEPAPLARSCTFLGIVRLTVPADWVYGREVIPCHFEASAHQGWIQLSAFDFGGAAGASVADAAARYAQGYELFGSEPVFEELLVDGLPAVQIVPSADQVTGFGQDRASAVVIKLPDRLADVVQSPTPNAVRWSVLILEGHVDYIREAATWLDFIESPDP